MLMVKNDMLVTFHTQHHMERERKRAEAQRNTASHFVALLKTKPVQISNETEKDRISNRKPQSRSVARNISFDYAM